MFKITKKFLNSEFRNYAQFSPVLEFGTLCCFKSNESIHFTTKMKLVNSLTNSVRGSTNAISILTPKLMLQTVNRLRDTSHGIHNVTNSVLNSSKTVSKSASSSALNATSTFENVLSLCKHALETNTPITSTEDIKVIISQVCQKSDVHPFDLSLILKAIHFSKLKKYLIRDDIIKLLDFCTKQNEHLSIQNYTHLCNLMSSSAIYVPHLLDIAFRKLYNELSTVRLKDMERIVTCLAYFNHEPSYGLNEVVEEFMRRDEAIEQNLIILYSMLESLCVFGIYPKPLIKRCFDEKCINQLLDMNYEIGNVLLTINTSFAIECYGECEDLLLKKEVPLDFAPVTMEQLLQKQGQLSNTEKDLVYCYSTIKKKFGKKVISTRLLPYFRFPDIVIVDKPEVKEQIGREIRPNMINDCTAFIIKHRNNYSDVYCRQIKGWHSLKSRLLTTIGYNVIEIPYTELSKLDSLLTPRRTRVR